MRQNRGRPESQHALGEAAKRVTRTVGNNTKRTKSNHRPSSSQSGGSRRASPTRFREDIPFTRSRSPVVKLSLDGNGHNMPHRTSSPSIFSRSRHAQPVRTWRNIFPSTVRLSFRLPFSNALWTASMDVRQAIENMLLISSLGFIAVKLRTCSETPYSPDIWISIGGYPPLILLRITSRILYYHQF